MESAGEIRRVDIPVHLPMRGERGRGKLISFSSHRHGGQECPPSLLARSATGLERVACGQLESHDTEQMKSDRQRILSMAFLIAALGLFVAFHFLPGFGQPECGWNVWHDVWRELRHMNFTFSGSGSAGTFVLVSFLNFSLLIVGAPFLKSVWPKSRLAWCLAVSFSGLAAGGFLAMYCVSGSTSKPGAGGWCLLLAPVLNFVGLLLARPQWLKKSGLPFPPENHSAS
jgi:hypothetical protein